jgi:LmbE family N-acetylglucosaminyl deacetylase
MDQGAQPWVVLLSSGGQSHAVCCHHSSALVATQRECTTRRVLAWLGIEEAQLQFCRFDDGELPHLGAAGFPAAVDKLAAVLRACQPHQIFVTHPMEGWSDHQAAEEITRAALRTSGMSAELYHYCVWFWFSLPLRRAWRVDWLNACLLDIGPVWDRKQAAIRMYLEDLAPCGVPWCGRLPDEMLAAFNWRKELFFRVPLERLR